MALNLAFQDLVEVAVEQHEEQQTAPTTRLGNGQEWLKAEERLDLGFTGLSNPFWSA